MSTTEDQNDKQYEPTQKKLEEARKKGELARSSDLNTAAAYAGFILVAMATGGSALLSMGELLAGLLAQPVRISESLFRDSARPVSAGILLPLTLGLAPWFLVPGGLVLLSAVAQRSLVFAPERLRPKLSRISPISNAANKFGRSGLFEFVKSASKLLIYSFLLAAFLYDRMPVIVVTVQLSPHAAVQILTGLIVEFLVLVLVIALMIGGIDFVWQYKEHLRKNRMSRKDLTDEAKQSEGDPHMKQQRRQKAIEIAMNKMLSEVPDADVVIVNPQHYAVALRWSRAPGSAPVCIAKGVDEMAARIREIATESGVPLYRDPPVARALHASVDIGQEILLEHYQAVAAAIRFAERMRRKAGGSG